MFTLPDLPYAYDALEPHFDAKTMEIHHSKHHAWYTKKLNAAIKDTDLEGKSIEELLTSPDALPNDLQQTIQNNGGWYYNHLLFWESLSPDGWWEASGDIGAKIVEQYWSFEAFQEAFTAKALGLFGSGWVYLCKEKDGDLYIKRHSFQETPLKGWHTPLLGLDVWEHSYYLHYQNRRGDYVKARWNIINWDVVNERYKG